MLVTAPGRVTLARAAHPSNADSSMVVSVAGRVTLVCPPGTATRVCMSFVYSTPSVDVKAALSSST